MMADLAMQAVSTAFPALGVPGLALPFAAGWPIGGTWRTALLPPAASRARAGLTSPPP